MAALIGLFLATPLIYSQASAAPLALCGNAGPGPAVRHVIVVMLENESQHQVVGNTTDAPYINGTLTKQCSYAASMFAATHYSAANYLALTAGQFPAESPAGCGFAHIDTTCLSAMDDQFGTTYPEVDVEPVVITGPLG